MRAPGTPESQRRRGFTLLELMVVNVLTGLMMILIAGAWRAFGPVCVEVIARSRIAGEANAAAASFYCDMHHYPPSRTFTGVQPSGDGQSFTISYQPVDQASPPWVVIYTWVPSADPINHPEDGKLTRSDNNGAITIARHVDNMVATALSSTSAEVKLSFFYRNSQSQYTFEIL